MIEDAIEEIRKILESGRRFERKGAYFWATAQYVRASAMAEVLARLARGGTIMISDELLAVLQDLVSRIRDQSQSLAERLGNGHGLAGRKKESEEILEVLRDNVERLEVLQG